MQKISAPQFSILLNKCNTCKWISRAISMGRMEFLVLSLNLSGENPCGLRSFFEIYLNDNPWIFASVRNAFAKGQSNFDSLVYMNCFGAHSIRFLDHIIFYELNNYVAKHSQILHCSACFIRT